MSGDVAFQASHDLEAVEPFCSPRHVCPCPGDLVGTAETAWGLDSMGMGGRLVVLTTFPDRRQPFKARHLVFRDAAILGSPYATRSEVAVAAHMVAKGDVTPVVGKVSGPGDVLRPHHALDSDALIGRGVLDWRPEPGGRPTR